jgi:plasmid stabilization system protein ParE
VLFRPEAEEEVLEARQWYESRSEGLGTRFAQAAASLLARIESNPRAFPRVHGATRRAVLTGFPYAIYFRTDHQHIVILAVHGRQDPSRWQTRS